MNMFVQGTAKQSRRAATAAFFIGLTPISLFGSTAGPLQELLGVGPMWMGLLISSPMLLGALLRIPFAAWVDATGGRNPILLLLTLSIAGMAGLCYLIYRYYPHELNAGHYPLLFLGGALSGCGIAVFSAGAAQISYWFPQQQQGRALGLFAGLGNLAPGIFALSLPFAVHTLGLAASYLAWLLFFIVGTVIYFLIGRNAPYFQYRHAGMEESEACQLAKQNGQEIFSKGGLVQSLRVSARRWENWVLMGVYFTSFGGFIALTAWFPFYWKSLFTVTMFMAGCLSALYSISTSLFRVAGGWVADRYGGRRILMGGCVLMLTGSVLMTQADILSMAVASCLVLALGMGFTNAAVFKLVPQIIPDAIGGASGWIGGLGTLGGFVIPPVLGAIVEADGLAGYMLGFYVFSALSVSAIILTFILIRNKGRV